MEKSFRSLAQDPWNKLKAYFCLRAIERQESPVERSRLLLSMAKAKRPTDPVLTLLLCEAALKLAPEDPRVLEGAEEVLKEWIPNPEHHRAHEEAQRLEQERKAKLEAMREALARLGIDGYFRDLAIEKGMSPDVLASLQGYQPTWQGVIQFLELAKLKNNVPPEIWSVVRQQVEDTLSELEPDHPDLPRVRLLATA